VITTLLSYLGVSLVGVVLIDSLSLGWLSIKKRRAVFKHICWSVASIMVTVIYIWSMSWHASMISNHSPAPIAVPSSGYGVLVVFLVMSFMLRYRLIDLQN